jgi:hypothetical protein
MMTGLEKLHASAGEKVAGPHASGLLGLGPHSRFLRPSLYRWVTLSSGKIPLVSIFDEIPVVV